MKRGTRLHEGGPAAVLPWVLLAIVGLGGLLVSSVVVFADWLLVPTLSLIGAPFEPQPWIAPAFFASAVVAVVGLTGLGVLHWKDRGQPPL